MFTDTQAGEKYLSLKEQFLKDLAKNIKNDTFKQNESRLREDLKKQVSEGKLF